MSAPARSTASGAAPYGPTRDDAVAALFDGALDQPTAARAAWLAARCGADDALRAEVESLLAAHARTGGILDATGGAPAALGPAAAPAVGRTIGPYRLVRELGRGGMGVVYLAERNDGQFERQVAVKLLHAGADGDELRRRFLAERQILATLAHPHIAQLLDGGLTEDQLPYLVIEYVDGLPITAWCDRAQLDVAERVRLFLDVCAAVQHAHGRLVLHRDLKPGNVLVTHDGAVKLLDFGIAKLLGPAPAGLAAVATRTAHAPMTPAYASPEQVRGDPLTTASDVYALGLLLYELLAGHRAQQVRGDALAAVLAAVCEREPTRPSDRVVRAPADVDEDAPGDPAAIAAARGTTPERLRRALRGDLDAIVAVALRKEPARRYDSVALLAEDLGRWLDGQPVLARRGSAAYRAGKLLRRHRLAATAAAAVLLAMVGGASAALWQAGIAARERDRTTAALVRSQDALRQSEEVAAFLVALFDASDATQGRTDTLSARDLLRRGDARVERLDGAPLVQARMLDALGRGHASLGDVPRGAALVRRALDLRRRHLGERHAETAATMARLAELLQRGGEYAAADSLARSAYAVRRALHGDAHRDVAASLHLLAGIAVYRDDPVRAERLARAALAGRRGAGQPDDSLTVRILESLARLRWRAADFDGAERTLREARDVAVRVFPRPHPVVALAQMRLADQLAERRDGWAEAEALYRAALAETRAAHGDAHPRTVDALRDVGSALAGHGRAAEGEALLRASLATARRLHGPRHAAVAYGLGALATAVAERGRLREAERLAAEAVLVYAAVWGERHSTYAGALGNRALLLSRLGEHDAAERLHRQAIAIRAAVFGPESRMVGVSETGLADALARRGRLPQAESVYVHALGIIRRYTTDAHVDARRVHAGLATVYAATGRRRDAAAHAALAAPPP